MKQTDSCIAMVFAAGIGSRLKPFTNFHPKALAPVAGIPVLERVLCNIRNAGIRDVVVNVHHFSNQIADFLRTSRFELNITISDETDCLLDTGGGLLKASHLLSTPNEKRPILLHNADIATDLPLAEMIAVHATSDADITLLAQERTSSRMLYFHSNSGLLAGWRNEKTGQIRPSDAQISNCTPMAFGGIHIISNATLNALKNYAKKSDLIDKPFSIIDFYLASINALRIKAYKPSASYRWFDIGTTEKLAIASQAFETDK